MMSAAGVSFIWQAASLSDSVSQLSEPPAQQHDKTANQESPSAIRQTAAAEIQASAALLQVAFNLFGLFGLGATIYYAHRAWKEAERSADAAHKTLEDATSDSKVQEERFNRQIEISETAARNQVRAYVHIDRIETKLRTDEAGNVQFYDITPVWKNFGSTPAMNLKTTANMVVWHEAELPPWFPFPDFPALWGPTGGDPSLLPQGKETFNNCGRIPVSVIDEVVKGWRRVFVWGTATYQDVYGRPCKTRFCWRANRYGFNFGDVVPNEIHFTYYQSYNCSDEQCYEEDANRPPVPVQFSDAENSPIGWILWFEGQAPNTYQRAPDWTPYHGEQRDRFGVKYP